MRNLLISVSKDVVIFWKTTIAFKYSGHQCHYRQLNHEKAHYSKFFKKDKVSSYSKKRKERKRKSLAKLQNRNRFGLRWREKGKKKTRTHCIKCTLVHIANLVLHLGMKPFPLKCWPRNYEQLSWKKLTKNKEGFLPRSRLAEGILIKFPRLLPLNRKSFPLWRTLRLTRKSILTKKQNMWCQCFRVNIYFTCLQSTTVCECSVQETTRITWIYSVAFPPTYDFACSHFSDYRIASHSSYFWYYKRRNIRIFLCFSLYKG